MRPSSNEREVRHPRKRFLTIGSDRLGVPGADEFMTNSYFYRGGAVYIEFDVAKAYEILRAAPARSPMYIETMVWAKDAIYHPRLTLPTGDHLHFYGPLPSTMPEYIEVEGVGNVSVSWDFVERANPTLAGIGFHCPMGVGLADGHHRLARAAQLMQRYFPIFVLEEDEFWECATKYVETAEADDILILPPHGEKFIQRVEAWTE